MKPSSNTRTEANLAIAALCAIGLFAGSYVLATGGFAHTAKWSKSTVFVSGPQAYFMAGIFFTLSLLAALVLLRSARAKLVHYVFATFAYLGATYGLVNVLR